MKFLLVLAASAPFVAVLPAQAQLPAPAGIQLAASTHDQGHEGGGNQDNGSSGGDNPHHADGIPASSPAAVDPHTGNSRHGQADSPGGANTMAGPTDSGGPSGAHGRTHGGTIVTAPTIAPVAGDNHGRTLPANTVFRTRPAHWDRFPRQFDQHVYQRNVTAPQRFHWQTYARPHGWAYSRWMFGQVLPRMFWSRNYWLNDYWMFDLPIPPYGYVWVRYGDDAILINARTGRVLQVVYDLFD